MSDSAPKSGTSSRKPSSLLKLGSTLPPGPATPFPKPSLVQRKGGDDLEEDFVVDEKKHASVSDQEDNGSGSSSDSEHSEEVEAKHRSKNDKATIKHLSAMMASFQQQLQSLASKSGNGRSKVESLVGSGGKTMSSKSKKSSKNKKSRKQVPAGMLAYVSQRGGVSSDEDSDSPFLSLSRKKKKSKRSKSARYDSDDDSDDNTSVAQDVLTYTDYDVISFVRTNEWHQGRNRYECKVLARVIDALYNGRYDEALETAARRFAGVYNADKSNNWDFAAALDERDNETLLSVKNFKVCKARAEQIAYLNKPQKKKSSWKRGDKDKGTGDRGDKAGNGKGDRNGHGHGHGNGKGGQGSGAPQKGTPSS